MAEIRDLPGQLDVVLYVGRPTTLTLTWPSTLAGRTFTCRVSYGGAADIIYTVAVSTVTMTIVLAATDYAAESGPGTIRIIETTGGLTTPVIVGAVTVTRTPGASSTNSTVTVASSTVTVTLGVNIGVVAVGQIPTFTNLAAVVAAYPSPAAGTLVRITSPADALLYYDGVSTWLSLAPPTTWTAASFLNSWTNFGSGYELARYRKIGDVVYLQGLIKSGTLGLSAFMLPVGFRPPLNAQWACTANGVFGSVTVDTTGNVIPVVGSTVNFQVDGQFSTI